MTALTLDNIHHSFGATEVVKGVSFSVDPGKLACLLGPSGCGKTTLLRIAAGLETVQSGYVEINGQRMGDGATHHHVPPEKRGIGLMFQDYALFPHLSIFDNITYGISDHKNRKQREEWADHALDSIGLSRFRDAFPHTLSGGQKQRVALIRALAPEPRVLLLDEPFSGLDVTRREQIRKDTLILLRETGVAAMMVTHDPEEAMFMADHILVMDQGLIKQAGTPHQTYFEPVDAFVAELFGPVNRFSAMVKNGVAATQIGDLPTGEHPEGSKVEVLVRPEGIILSQTPATDTQSASVITARLLGRSSYILLELDGQPDHTPVRIEARVPGVFLPPEGIRLHINAAPEHTFVFSG